MKCRFFISARFNTADPHAFSPPFSVRPGLPIKKTTAKVAFFMVGLTGLEPATSSSRTKRSTRLNYNPKVVHMFTT